MFCCPVTPAFLRRSGWIAFGLFVGLTSASVAHAQAAPAPAPAQQAAAPTKRVFASDAGMILNFIKPDKTADFEEVMAKLKEALQKSDKPERKQQAASWKVFKSPDPAGANVLYVFVIEPSVKDADYTVSNILAELYKPEELNVIFKKYAESYAQGQNIINLNLTIDFGK
ncbi:MAG: hypothetical protein ABJA98_19070 [Acidobacteriota bacterium]